jgi:phosphatidylserine/phosphatidylglycerophosphate/cardiolipin synthase-like enzyme
MSVAQVHFSNPDGPPGQLRDLLAERIRRTPSGGSIDWVSYYFRDRRLAHDLVRASRRGVDVRVTIDGLPRTRRANDAVIRILSGSEGLGAELRVVRSWKDALPRRKRWRPRLHEKLYCFSHPVPVAIVGSFNPSGDVPEEDPAVVREIGNHDRGYNTLVEIGEPELARSLSAHARELNRGDGGSLARVAPSVRSSLASGDLEIRFWPQMGATPVADLTRRIAAGSRLRIAASRVSGRTAVAALTALARRGVAIEMLTEWTQRRVPSSIQDRLAGEGISIRRVRRKDDLPMHDKFALVEEAARRSVLFGSFNWSESSLRYNRELSIVSREPKLFETFAARWESLQRWA